ncbi:putative disease resistance protein RGA3 [Oryza brachyantha]|uniref:AAA+ ATPase domain-containing protein n=1 Tax=Oryza brachyantha TaxID=4533 RepID=J3MKW0_ORYBR|nr:putative disease resistance protein RGA3 [Oryza brachyantha]XP_040381955.1 putative disease resistance protein RGA3 [Oryza brachyantha]
METILAGYTKDVVMSLGNLAANEIAKVLCVKNEINKLKRKLETMTAIIRDAEQTVVQYETTRDWLKRLRGIAYEAENIIDRCRIEQERLQMFQPQECNPSSLFKCCRDVAVDYMIANDIHELNQELESIKSESTVLHLNPVTEDQIRLDLDVAPDLEPDIVGREVENDCDTLIQLLKRDYITTCPLFAIVGTIGVGKTTLARKVYHRAATMFETRLWVHMSKDLQHLTMWYDGMFKKAETAEQQALLLSYLQGKKFLLVIDDVWGENVWDGRLEIQAQHGAPGSRVLVTSRDERVARRMGAIHLHTVKMLNEDDAWWLLRTRAFLDESAGNMQDIGRRIVQKCNGLPMAIRRIGCHLRDVDPKEDDWRRVCSSDFCGISARIRSTINMSYLELPYYLKRCFLYCALYPEGFVIDRQCITRQWIAEGFIVSQTNSTTVEEEAQRCYDELLGRGLLLPEIEDYDVVGSKMPHLFRSFALLQSQDENFTGNPQDIGDVFKPCRLSVTHGGVEAIRNGIKKLKNLRTLLLSGSAVNDRALSDIFLKFTHLRVLDLGNTRIECVTVSLGRMAHLRYLSFANTQVREIPGTIENLRMLHFLILRNCICLNALPESVGRLKNLRSLDISGAGLNIVSFRFSQMRELNCLQGFLVSPSGAQHRSGWPFQELSSLSKLTSLQMLRIERELNAESAKQSALREKCHLKELELCCSLDEQTTQMGKAENVKDVFEELAPAPSVLSIKMENYYGHEFPSWLSSPALSKLQRLTLAGCSHCSHLPSLGQMSNLKYLAIIDSNLSATIGPELRGNPDNGVAFPKLQQLLISEMSNLKSWRGIEEGDMPSLVNLRLERCPKLESLPRWLEHCTALRSFRIDRADSLKTIENLPAVRELEVHRNKKLKRILNLGSLEGLKVVHCLVLKVVQGVPSLRTVHSDDRNSTELPPWLQPQEPFILKRLEIIGTEELLDKCSSASSPYWSSIQHADHVFAHLPDDTFYFSYTKSNGSFHRSARSLARSSLYSSPSFVMPSVTQGSDVIAPEEDAGRNMQIEIGRSRSQSWVRTELFAVLLFVAAHLFFLSTAPASAH